MDVALGEYEQGRGACCQVGFIDGATCTFLAQAQNRKGKQTEDSYE